MFETNGDSKLLALIQPSIYDEKDEMFKYKNWIYPTNNYYQAISTTGNNTLPEGVMVSSGEVKRMCEGKDGCGLIVGVEGLT